MDIEEDHLFPRGIHLKPGEPSSSSSLNLDESLLAINNSSYVVGI